MKKIIILFLIFQLFSCDSKYDGDIRLQLQGKVVDESNNPIENQEIIISSGNESYSDNANNIGYGKTDSNGNYSILIPAASDSKTYSLKINDEFELNYNSQLTSATFYNIKKSNFLNYKIQLPTSKHFQKTNVALLNVTFIQINTSNELSSVEFIGEIANENVDINNEFLEYEYFKQVKKNQIVEIRYKVKNISNSVITTNSSFVTIGNSDNINQTIDY